MSQSTTSSQDRQAHEPYVVGEVVVLSADDVRVVDEPVRGSARVDRVTAARGSHSDDVGRRMRTYGISMGVRTLCVLAAVLSFPHWWAWLFVPGAVVLPYVAVVLANVGGERVPVAPASVTLPPTSLPVLRAADAA